MTLLKKIILLLICFVVLNVVSIYVFDYNELIDKNERTSSSVLNIKTEENYFMRKVTELKNKVFDSFSERVESKPVNLLLVKKDGLVEMSGLFANEQDARKIADVLTVNREGEYKYEDDRVIDEYILEDLAILITPFKEFFTDNSKLSLVNNEVFLSGELRDASYKDLLDSILLKVKIDLKTDITFPIGLSAEDMKRAIEKNNEEYSDENKSVQSKTEAVPISSNKVIPDNSKQVKTSKLPSKLDAIQLEINNVLSTKKITFERKSSVLTEDSNLVVQDIAKILNKDKSFKLEVSGHTDSRGKESLNKQISQDRASSVRDVLIAFGVDKDRITAVGYGEERPIAKDDENGLSEINRRVEFNILGE